MHDVTGLLRKFYVGHMTALTPPPRSAPGLINPAKSEIGKVSKQLLDRINKKVIASIKINQWKNTASVLAWFNSISNKDQYSFIAFDVVDFYPSISIDLLNGALDFASNYDNITDDERNIILHAKKYLPKYLPI